jgi:hypothetical protein
VIGLGRTRATDLSPTRGGINLNRLATEPTGRGAPNVGPAGGADPSWRSDSRAEDTVSGGRGFEGDDIVKFEREPLPAIAGVVAEQQRSSAQAHE